jgi:hypothetical protein
MTAMMVAVTETLATPSTAGALAIGLLLVLLSEKEVLRAFGGERAKVGGRALNVAIAPLLLVSFAILAFRFLHLIGLGRGS